VGLVIRSTVIVTLLLAACSDYPEVPREYCAGEWCDEWETCARVRDEDGSSMGLACVPDEVLESE